METRIDRIGLDLGSAAQAEALADAAAELGPDMVRQRFGLEGHVEPDADHLADASQAVDALRERGLRVLAVIDSDLTVAPEGMGAFLDRPPGPLARAWTDEIVSNAGRLARANCMTGWAGASLNLVVSARALSSTTPTSSSLPRTSRRTWT